MQEQLGGLLLWAWDLQTRLEASRDYGRHPLTRAEKSAVEVNIVTIKFSLVISMPPQDTYACQGVINFQLKYVIFSQELLSASYTQ